MAGGNKYIYLDVDDPPYIDDWNWKTNLELAVGLPESQ